MTIEKKESYIKQIAIYLKNGDYEKAYTLSNEMIKKFQNEMISYFLLAKSSFWTKRYDEALSNARIAFNLSKGKDMLPCAALIASAYYQLRQYQKGYEFLEKLEETNEDIEELKTIFALSISRPDRVTMHVKKLFEINKKIAEDFIIRLLIS